MRRRLVALGPALLIGAFFARPAIAAVEITVSVSPAEGVVGRPMEVLVRTYVPVGAGDLGLPLPSLSYPAPSGLWDVLYPIADYPFDVEVRSPTGETTQIDLARDSSDASLWRGVFTPNAAGGWSISISNFPTNEPTRFMVRRDETGLAMALGSIAGLVVGVIAGVMLGTSIAARRSRTRGDDAV